MSTWLDDLKRTNPKLAADYAIAGSYDSVSLGNMIRALSGPMAFFNTPEDEARLAAAKRIRAAQNRKAKR